MLKVRYLEDKNKDFDCKIKFEDIGHRYWAFSDYYKDWVSTSNGVGAAPILSTTTFLKQFWHDSMTRKAFEIWSNPENRLKMETDPLYKYYGCKSVDDIKEIWSEGARQGTKMHGHYEDLANCIEYDRDHPEDDTKTMAYLYNDAHLEGYYEKYYFYKFLKTMGMDKPDSDIVFHRTEYKMWHPVLHISGTIDALLYDKKDDSYIIVDWKRCKGGVRGDSLKPKKTIEQLAPNSKGLILPAFKKLRKNNLNQYGCQLTLYKHMFESMSGKRVSKLLLVAVDSEKIGKDTAFKIHDVPLDKYDECILQAFELRAREMLSEYCDTMDSKHMDDVLKFLPNDSETEPEEEEEEEEMESPRKKQKNTLL
jgi:hypothetical protein